MCNVVINTNTCKCKTCSLRSVTEVAGDDHAIKREFDRIERACQFRQDGFVANRIKQEIQKACQHKQGWEFKYSARTDAQTKSPSAGTDGL